MPRRASDQPRLMGPEDAARANGHTMPPDDAPVDLEKLAAVNEAKRQLRIALQLEIAELGEAHYKQAVRASAKILIAALNGKAA